MRAPFLLGITLLASWACSTATTDPVASFEPDPTSGARSGADTTTTPSPFPPTVSIVGFAYRAGTGVPTDTGAVSTEPPVPGVAIRIQRNVLRDGKAAQILMATVTTDARGAFASGPLPGGYYVLEALGPGGDVVNYQLVATSQAVTKASVWVP
ncbi:MAG: hypothetical protein AB7S39_13860 [Gemmatimonadales bacterium]